MSLAHAWAACCVVSIMAASQLAAIMRATAQSHGAQPYAMGQMLAESLLELYGVDEQAFGNCIEGIEETLQLTLHGAAAEEEEPREAKNDRLASELLLRNVRQHFDVRLRTDGTRPAALQQQADTISQALFSDDLVAKKLLSAVSRVTHISRNQFLAGGRLQEDNAASLSVSDVRSSNQRAVRSDYVDLDWIYEWFHTKSDDVEVDKSTKYKYKVKRAFVAGKRRHLQCDMRILTTTVEEAVANFKKSPEWNQFRLDNPDVDLHDKNIARCICPCMKPDKREECACPTCGEMHELLKGLKNVRKTNQELHHECSCRHDCANPNSVYRKAASSFSSLEGACLCEGRPHPGLELPHLPEQPPIFRNLACCLQPKRNRDDIVIGTKPEGVPKCRSCGWAARFGSYLDDDDATVRCPVDYSDEQPATWMRREEVDVGSGKMGLRYCAHTGTRAELMQCIEDALPEFFYHRWLIVWIKWQFKLDIATFDRRNEILVVTDFAALYEMKGKKVSRSFLATPITAIS